jgi:pimeloyl-ACP methyl ester carboxylesterase
MWDAQIAAWSHRFRVIAPDWRGFGESPPSDEEFTMESCADDLQQLLRDRKVKETIVLLGLSMGGYIAFEFFRKYQDQLRGLILAATQPIADSEPSRKARYETAELVQKEGTDSLAGKLIPRLLGKTTLETKPEVVETVRSLIRSNSPQGIAKACDGLARRRDSSSLLDEIQIPTLVLAGSEDAIVPRVQAETLHQNIPSSRLTLVDESGHLINLEQPGRFQDAVLSFLKGL